MTKDETIYIRLTAELRQRLEAESKRRGEALSVIVREALREYFERKMPAVLKGMHEFTPKESAPLALPESSSRINQLNDPASTAARPKPQKVSYPKLKRK